MQREKSEDIENKEILRFVCTGRTDTSVGMLFFNMEAKQGQTNTGKLEVMKNAEQSYEAKIKKTEGTKTSEKS